MGGNIDSSLFRMAIVFSFALLFELIAPAAVAQSKDRRVPESFKLVGQGVA